MSKIRALCTIVDYKLGEHVKEVFMKNKSEINILTHGFGTASSEIIEMLGVQDTKKMLTLSLLDERQAKKITNELIHKLNLDRPGTGIIFALPVSSVSKYIVENIIDYKTEESDEKESFDMSKYEHELIITIITREYIEAAKEAANNAGAGGGTVIHGMGLGADKANKFLGITINPEKDIMLTVVRKEKKEQVMKSILNEVGLETQGKGICFSMPVDYTVGLSKVNK